MTVLWRHESVGYAAKRMLIAIFVIVGAFIGAVNGDIEGMFIGGLVGFAIANWIRSNAKHNALVARIAELEKRLVAGTVVVSEAALQTQSETQAPTPIVQPREPVIADPPSVEPARPRVDVTAPILPSAPAFDPIAAVRNFLFGGNTVVRVGIIILLFGVGFLVKYAADNAYLPIELRLLGAVLLGIALLVIGFRVREKRLAYAVSLQGGGIGIIYVVTFAALKIYDLIPASAALAIFIVLGVTTAILSILQDAIALAVLGIIGGFLAPILASTGSGDHVALFTYYAILNAGILGIAWFKAWRVLNLIGFTFTFVIGTMWGVTSYAPEHFESAQFFLALFFAFYAAIAVIYALKRPEQRGFIDTTLVFGLPVVTFALEVSLVVHTEWGLAIASIILAAFYVGVAALAYTIDKAHGRALAEAFTAIGLTFVTLALPFALNASWTAAAYALEGAGLVWVGRKQNRPLAEFAGVFLQFAAGFAFDTPGSVEITQPKLDAVYPYAFLRAVGALASAYFIRTRPTQVGGIAQGLLILWAIGWLTGGVVFDTLDHGQERHILVIGLTAIAIHAALLEAFASWRTWWAGRFGALTLAPLMVIGWTLNCILMLYYRHDWAWVGWIVASITWLVLVRRHEKTEHPGVSAAAYGLTPMLLAAVAGLNAYLAVHKVVPEGVWALSAGVFALVAVVSLILASDMRNRWPMLAFRRAMLIGCEPVILFLAFYSFMLTFSSDGDARPLPYIPLVSPLDLTQLFIVLTGVAWSLRLRVRDRERFDVLAMPSGVILAALLFVHLSAVCVRSVHHFAHVPFDFDSLAASNLVQTSLSITWSVIALIVTVTASRNGWRGVWFVGGALLALVVVKLFAVDLSNIATVARIVSFLVVGILLLLIGWLSPLPPRTARAA